MKNLVQTLLQYCNDPDFRIFQNDISEKMYKSLSNSYGKTANEVKIVTDLCNAISGISYNRIKFYANKIHGKASMVRFLNTLNSKNSNPTKELADMVVISIATYRNNVIFEKLAFIQNKKESSQENWSVDQDQLFLLHNFPNFDVVSGALKKIWTGKTALKNASGQLGNYGLFLSPGEMLFANAKLISMIQTNKAVTLSNITKANVNNRVLTNPIFSLFEPFFVDDVPRCCVWHDIDYPILPFHMPILGSCEFASNTYEFIRNWTQFNIGEPVIANNEKLDYNLFQASRYFLKAAGFNSDFEILDDKDFPLTDFESDAAVLVMHISLDSDE